MRSEYPVLAPVSEGYPKAEGRLLTCYSPVRHSPPAETDDPFDLHVLSTPPAFVLSQDQTLHQKLFGEALNRPSASKEPHHEQSKTAVAYGVKLMHWLLNTLLSSQATTTHLSRPDFSGPLRGDCFSLAGRISCS